MDLGVYSCWMWIEKSSRRMPLSLSLSLSLPLFYRNKPRIDAGIRKERERETLGFVSLYVYNNEIVKYFMWHTHAHINQKTRFLVLHKT